MARVIAAPDPAPRLQQGEHAREEPAGVDHSRRDLVHRLAVGEIGGDCNDYTPEAVCRPRVTGSLRFPGIALADQPVGYSEGQDKPGRGSDRGWRHIVKLCHDDLTGDRQLSYQDHRLGLYDPALPGDD